MTSSRQDIPLISIATAVIWTACLAVGALGLRLRYEHPRAPAPQPQPVQAKMIDAEIAPAMSAPPQAEAASPPRDSQPQPPPPPDIAAAPPEPPLAAVLTPSPVIAMPKPVEKSIHAVDTTQVSAAAPSPSPPYTVRLVYGQGEGKQPLPEYPREAQIAQQQGVVLIHFIVAENGRVTSAQAISPCHWPLLNQAALRAVRETYRFRPGPARAFDISIEFKLE